MSNGLIVAFRCRTTSLGALRWAIRRAWQHSVPLTVVHAASLPISVRNGPSADLARRMGDPDWATVHTTVEGLGAPAETTTVVGPGCHVDLLVEVARPGDLFVLGPRRRWWFGRADTASALHAATGSPAVRIPSDWIAPRDGAPATTGQPLDGLVRS